MKQFRYADEVVNYIREAYETTTQRHNAIREAMESIQWTCQYDVLDGQRVYELDTKGGEVSVEAFHLDDFGRMYLYILIREDGVLTQYELGSWSGQ